MLSINPAHRIACNNKTTKSFLYYLFFFKGSKDDLSSHGLTAVFLSDQRKYPTRHQEKTQNQTNKTMLWLQVFREWAGSLLTA